MTGVTVAAQDQMMRRGGQRLKPIDLAREFGRLDCLVGADRDAEAGRPPARERGGQTGGFAEKGNGGDRAVSVGEREAARAQLPGVEPTIEPCFEAERTRAARDDRVMPRRSGADTLQTDPARGRPAREVSAPHAQSILSPLDPGDVNGSLRSRSGTAQETLPIRSVIEYGPVMNYVRRTDTCNNGMLVLGTAATVRPVLPRTIIVTGVARSGTSMVARVLQSVGLYLGDELDDVVFEDNEFGTHFEAGDRAALAALIARRDGYRSVWGCKRPQLHGLGPSIVDLFRRPMVIATFRDPIAIAERNIRSELYQPDYAFADAREEAGAFTDFIAALSCPRLLVSYEKAIRHPALLVEQLLAFTGLEPLRSEDDLAALVEPERDVYRAQARRIYQGYLDVVDGNTLRGWAREPGRQVAVEVSLLRDGEAVAHAVANGTRADLQAAGLGACAFSFDLDGLDLRDDTILSVEIRDRTFTLRNSGCSLARLRAAPGH